MNNEIFDKSVAIVRKFNETRRLYDDTHQLYMLIHTMTLGHGTLAKCTDERVLKTSQEAVDELLDETKEKVELLLTHVKAATELFTNVESHTQKKEPEDG